ncbi:MAG: DUF2059 domain-containing protein [Nereida ignava]|uniref:DUF2059 domain-containing protein n=1 Tax=Nereida ignava TaxID=282199 RepID=UPI0030FCC69F
MIFRSLAAPLSIALTFSLTNISFAQQSSASALFDVMKLGKIISVMREEGLAYGASLGDEMMPGRSIPEWPSEVARVYDQDKMIDGMRDAFVATLGDRDMGPIVAFFESDLGQDIVELEYSARVAFLDEAIEEGAIAQYQDREAENDPMLAAVKSFVATNDYVEANVAGALNSNFAFYTGMIDGGALSSRMSESDILADVWAQEPEIRANTEEWLYSYLLMAYQPLGVEGVNAYEQIMATAEGRAMNAALFESFDQMYVAISRELGQSVAGYMLAEEL